MGNKYDDQYMLDYLDGILSPEEKSLFEKDLQTNSALKERLGLLKFTINGIKLKGYKDSIKQVQQEFLQNRLENKKFTPIDAPKLEKKERSLYFWGKAAAAVSLLVLFGFLFYLLRNDGSSLYEGKYISYEIAAERGFSEQENILESLFINGEFRQMFQVSAERDQDQLSPRELLLLGNAALELDSASASLPYFQRLDENNTNSGTDTFQDEVDFFLALSYLKLGEYQNAYNRVVKIRADDRHKYNNNFSRLDQLSIKFRILF
ncbi:hypothetical protein [Cyclobacterium plantarum]|uniref:hypothetical protein n=1 Tax=Cyclobacterium plantarum TaxID=2716263 RepID=UPI003F6F0B08